MLIKQVIIFIILLFNCIPTIYAEESLSSLFKKYTGIDVSEKKKPVILLVHGLTVDVNKPSAVWGEYQIASDGSAHWNGMIRYLSQHDLSFGGIIDANKKHLILPDSLNHKGAIKYPQKADFFALSFSPDANDDGIAYKVLELKKTLQELKSFTGRDKAIIIAHSAGGLVARAYMQNAIPRAIYNNDVQTLITIATPHLGSTYARLFGQLGGVKATSLKPSSPLIKRLNTQLELNPDSKYASIIIKGLGADITGKGKAYNRDINPELLKKLPYDFLNGGDQVVHAKSQNLMLTPTAQRYEKKTRKPILYLIARVEDPTPKITDFSGDVVHTVAPSSSQVQKIVLSLIKNKEKYWQPATTLKQQLDKEALQSEILTIGIIERSAIKRYKHYFSQVDKVSIEEYLTINQKKISESKHKFQGTAYSYNKLLKLRKRKINVTGEVIYHWDKFGRISFEDYKILKSSEDEF